MHNPPQTLWVFDDFSADRPVLLGRLSIERLKGAEFYAFEYDANWLKRTHLAWQLDPVLKPRIGKHHAKRSCLFGLFADASPDQWGQRLLMQQEHRLAEKDGRKPSKLYPSDFLLSVDDATRQGGLRVALSLDDPLLVNKGDSEVASWETLPVLATLSQRFERNPFALSDAELCQLVRAGAALGGSRPKAMVIDRHQALWIAKFPSQRDTNDTGAWEMVVHDLAQRCGLRVSEAKLERFSSLGSTFLVKRFDRIGQRRVHCASAMTLLGATEDVSSYLDLVDIIRAQGAHPQADLVELWKRIVFNMAVSNTDDHLRNHAFILEPTGWVLSPLYDVNPVPHGDALSLNVDEYDNRLHIRLAVRTAERFGISESDAVTYAQSIQQTVRAHWERIATQYGLSTEQIEAMRPAFCANDE